MAAKKDEPIIIDVDAVEVTSEDAVDYLSNYDFDKHIKHVTTTEAAISKLVALNDQPSLSDEEKDEIRKFLNDNKEEIATLFDENKSELFASQNVEAPEKSESFTKWLTAKFDDNATPISVREFLTAKNAATELANWVKEDKEPYILLQKSYTDENKIAIKTFLENNKHESFRIFNDPNINLKERLNQFDEWVQKNQEDMQIPEEVREFFKSPTVVKTLQKQAIFHELAIDIKKVYADGDKRLDIMQLVRDKYNVITDGAYETNKKSLDAEIALTTYELRRLRDRNQAIFEERKELINKRASDLAADLSEEDLRKPNIKDKLYKEAVEGWKLYINNRSTAGSSTFKTAQGKAPVGKYTAPDNVIPKAHGKWFYQGIAKCHYSNWGIPFYKPSDDLTSAKLEKTKFVNMHINLTNAVTLKLAGLNTVHILYRNLPRMFTGSTFDRPLIKDVDTSIEKSGLIDPIKKLQDKIIAIAFKVEHNKFTPKEAITHITDAYNKFADKYSKELQNLEFNTQKRLDELEVIKPEKKYSGKEGFVKHTKEAALNYVQDINWMAINLARKGEDNEVLQELVNYIKKLGGDRTSIYNAIEAGTKDRFARMGREPEMRLAGLTGDHSRGLDQPLQSDFFRLERSLDVGMYQKATRFTARIEDNNAELIMGNVARYHEKLVKEALANGSQVKWDVEAANEFEGMLNDLYEAGSEHEAGRALRLAIMRMGRKADKTVSRTLTTKIREMMSKNAASDPHRSQWAAGLLNIMTNVPDSPWKFGARHAWSMMFRLAEFAYVGWAFAAENSMNKKWYNPKRLASILKLDFPTVLGFRTGGVPSRAIWNNTMQGYQQRFKAYITGGTTELVTSESQYGDPDVFRATDKKLVAKETITKTVGWGDKKREIVKYNEGAPLKGFDKFSQRVKNVTGRLARDVIAKPAYFLATGGLRHSKHIFWASVVAAEITAISIGALHGVQKIGDMTGMYDMDRPSYSHAYSALTTGPRLAWNSTVFNANLGSPLGKYDFNTMTHGAADGVTKLAGMFNGSGDSFKFPDSFKLPDVFNSNGNQAEAQPQPEPIKKPLYKSVREDYDVMSDYRSNGTRDQASSAPAQQNTTTQTATANDDNPDIFNRSFNTARNGQNQNADDDTRSDTDDERESLEEEPGPFR